MNPKSRLLSLDVMRGITIAGMILVNNPGNWANVYAPLTHAEWNGLTPTDLVFPFFMFIMGVSMDFSLRKYHLNFNAQIIGKIIKRTVVIFAIGIAIAWFGNFCRNIFNITSDLPFHERLIKGLLPFESLRILGVMQRLAISYCGGAFLSLIVRKRFFLFTAFSILVIYALILFFGNGYEFSQDNIIAVIDRTVLGTNHMYTKSIADVSMHFDPEGIISTIPCIAHVMLGMYVGRIILDQKENIQRIGRIFVFGTSILFVGFLLSYGIPINKSIWSPTFVLVTCGLGSLLLGLLIWIVDMKQHVKWCRFFESFGINPLFMYVLGAFLGILFTSIKFWYYGSLYSITSFLYQKVFLPAFGAMPASLMYSILFISINWIIGYQLYKRKIYIKI